MCVIEEVKKFASICLNSVADYFSDRYASIVPVGGISMSPTFNPLDDSSMRSLTRNYSFFSLLCS